MAILRRPVVKCPRASRENFGRRAGVASDVRRPAERAFYHCRDLQQGKAYAR
jgi:hypothetical protein